MRVSDTFDGLKFKSFDLYRLFGEFYKETVKNSEIIVSRGFFIAPCMEVKAASSFLVNGTHIVKEEAIFYPSFTLNNFGFIAGRFANTRLHSTTFPHFISELFHFEKRICRFFLDVLYEHLKNRSSGGTMLTDYDSIKISIAEVAANLALIDTRIPDDPFLTHTLLLDTAENLMKLSGGRAYLSHSVIDLINLMQVLNNLYLSKEVL